MGDQTRVDTVGQDRGRTSRVPAAQRQGGLAQRIVGALGRSERGIEIATAPGLQAGIQITNPPVLAPGDEIEAADIDGQVEQEIALAQSGFQQRAVVVAGEGLDGQGDAKASGKIAVTVLGGQDAELV